MHQPRPYGTFGAATEEDAAAVELLVRRLTNWKQLGGLESLRLSRTLPSGALAIAQDMGGVLKVIVQPPTQPQPEPAFDGVAKGYIPMLFSGVIDRGVARNGGGIFVRFSSETRRRLAGYDPNRFNAIPKQAEMRRFVVEMPQRFAELMPSTPVMDGVFTQYAKLRPTWFSGAMAELVQIVGGYGRQQLGDLPDNPIERARFGVPPKVMREIETEMGNVRLPGYTGLPHGGGEIRYDYKANETHLVGFDSQKKPWLVQVNPSGVHAMPLPMIPATTTRAFRRFIEAKNDTELLWALDRFGGLPSGEGFPIVQKDFQAWRRAGVIIKVCDVADFYQHMMYSSAMGWTMNSSGTEGFNTCYDMDDESQISYSLAYKLSLRLGPANAEGKLPEAFHIEDPIAAQRLTAYLARLYEYLKANDARALAIKYKLRRVDVAEILLRAEAEFSRAEVDYWDNLELPPIAVHGGGVAQIARGYIPWRRDGFKVPEPFTGGCVSFMAPGKPKPGATVPEKADTILAGYYIGDQLKVVKFFSDERKYTRSVEDNFDECMTVGSWERTTTTGMTGLMGDYYTSDFDDRQAAADTTEVQRIVGTDLGYDSKPFFSYDNWFWRPGTLWRNRYFKHKTITETTSGYLRAIAVCMPFFDRNAALHARRDTYSGKKVTESTEMHSVPDPYSYRYWTDDFVWAWIGGVSGPQAKVPVYPKNGNPVWVVQENYNPELCSDFADSGPWIPGLPADYTWLIHPDNNRWVFSGGGGPPSVNEETKTTNLPGKTEGQIGVSVISYTLRLMTPPHATYFLFSPDPYVGVFYRDAIKVVAGSCEYASVSEPHPTMDGLRAFQGWSELADHSTAHHFIGVING